MEYEILSIETVQMILKALKLNKKMIRDYQLKYGNKPDEVFTALRLQNKILRGLSESKSRDIRKIY